MGSISRHITSVVITSVRGGHTDINTDTQTDRQTDRQTDTHTHFVDKINL